MPFKYNPITNQLDITSASGGGGAITTITGNTGGAESPLAGNFNIVGSGSITVAGTANTETVQLTGLTNHSVLVGAGTATITKVGPSATIGAPLISAGASSDPVYSTTFIVNDSGYYAQEAATNSGGLVKFVVQNLDQASSASSSRLELNVGSTASGSTGDSYVLLYNAVTTSNWEIGQVGSTNDFVINYGSDSATPNISGSPAISITGSGAVTAPTSISSPEYFVTGSSSGVISVLPQANSGTYNFNLPITAGTSGYFLTSDGGGAGGGMTWTAPSGGTYYSVTPYIVGQSGDTHAQYTGSNAIANALAQIVTDGVTAANVYIKPGSYPDAFTIPAIGSPGINFIGLSAPSANFFDLTATPPSVNISGTITTQYVSGNYFVMNNIDFSGSITTSANSQFNGCFLDAGSSFINNLEVTVLFSNCQISSSSFLSSATAAQALTATFENCVIDTPITYQNPTGDSFYFSNCYFTFAGQIISVNAAEPVSLQVYNCIVTSQYFLNESTVTHSIASVVIDGVYVPPATGMVSFMNLSNGTPNWPNIANVIITNCQNLIYENYAGVGGTYGFTNCSVTTSGNVGILIGPTGHVTFDNSTYIGQVNAISGTPIISSVESFVTLNGTSGTPVFDCYGCTIQVSNSASNSFVTNTDNLSASALDGFLYLPTCNGLPSGTPTTYGSSIPIVIDNTTGIAYKYYLGAWIAL